ncbi:hypothetical protein V5O48_010652, partial [Marasmius crinis-equi]
SLLSAYSAISTSFTANMTLMISTFTYAAVHDGGRQKRADEQQNMSDKSFSLYSYFLVTVVLMLSVFTAIVFRARRARRQTPWAIEHAIWNPASGNGGNVDLAIKPSMFEARLGGEHDDTKQQKQRRLEEENGSSGFPGNVRWFDMMPLSVRYLSGNEIEGSSLSRNPSTSPPTRTFLVTRPLNHFSSFIPSHLSRIPHPSPHGTHNTPSSVSASPNPSANRLSNETLRLPHGSPSIAPPPASLGTPEMVPSPSQVSASAQVSLFVAMPYPKPESHDGCQKAGEADPAELSLPHLEIGIVEVDVRADASGSRG